jgi:hypothetical protein
MNTLGEVGERRTVFQNERVFAVVKLDHHLGLRQRVDCGHEGLRPWIYRTLINAVNGDANVLWGRQSATAKNYNLGARKWAAIGSETTQTPHGSAIRVLLSVGGRVANAHRFGGIDAAAQPNH